jgi:hypothetical protein
VNGVGPVILAGRLIVWRRLSGGAVGPGKRGDEATMARAMKAGGFKLFRLQRPVDKVPEKAQAVAEVMCPDLMGS